MGGQRVIRVDMTWHLLQFVALLVDQQLTLGALETLSTQAPYAVLAEFAKGTLREIKV